MKKILVFSISLFSLVALSMTSLLLVGLPTSQAAQGDALFEVTSVYSVGINAECSDEFDIWFALTFSAVTNDGNSGFDFLRHILYDGNGVPISYGPRSKLTMGLTNFSSHMYFTIETAVPTARPFKAGSSSPLILILQPSTP